MNRRKRDQPISEVHPDEATHSSNIREYCRDDDTGRGGTSPQEADLFGLRFPPFHGDGSPSDYNCGMGGSDARPDTLTTIDIHSPQPSSYSGSNTDSNDPSHSRPATQNQNLVGPPTAAPSETVSRRPSLPLPSPVLARHPILKSGTWNPNAQDGGGSVQSVADGAGRVGGYGVGFVDEGACHPPIFRAKSNSSLSSRNSVEVEYLKGSNHWNQRKMRKKKNAEKRLSGISHLSEQSNFMDKRWNVFRSIPRDKNIIDPKWIILISQIFKFVTYMFLFTLVLAAGFVSKMVVLLMSANLRANVLYTRCKAYGEDMEYIPQGEAVLPGSAVAMFYWSLWVGMSFPEVLTLFRCLRIVTFKFVPTPSVGILLGAWIVDTMRTIGISLLVFVVLPDLDSVRAALLMCGLATVPTLLSAFGHIGVRWGETWLYVVSDGVAFCLQVTALWLWPALTEMKYGNLLPYALILTSFGWWENFVSKSAELRFIAFLGHVKERLQKSRYKTNILLSTWRIVLSFFCMVLAAGTEHKVTVLFDFGSPFGNTTAMEDWQVEQHDLTRTALGLLLWLVFSSLVCYQGAKFACKVRMERFSYAVPVMCVVPVVMLSLVSFCETKKEQPCHFRSWLLPDTVFWRCDYGSVYEGLLFERLGWVGILWFFSYLWITSYIFTQKTSRLSRTDSIFVTPMYEGLLLDQSLTLNRRRQQSVFKIRTRDLEDEDKDDVSVVTGVSDLSNMYSTTSMSLANSNADTITKIYICATMWHETANEMTQVLSSVMRMDEDQSARKNAQKYLKVVDRDYYELEAHIFFDNAWDYDEKLKCRIPNEYVKTFVSVVNEAARLVHKIPMKLRPPLKISTPYGGRLVYTLPGDTKLFVHLKDKVKIRHKKRWSQVMYMYYLLGHRVMELIPELGRKQRLADNTFILALDGDSNFSPSSVQKLVDLMKKHSRLGSACGRIHPIGTGMMVWYQKFEYAIAHWFQKATEHVFGCVLCAPGCFSLFRGSALMDDNVMNKYTKLASEARHFVQFDQGEDRWLSTLLLKQGYRIEYAAASDADTYAPEGFDEFFNQRRRWTPSSIANTLDLLFDFKRVVANNDSISRLYIAYQMLVICFSMLSPAIIFTMLVFAQSAVFGWDSWTVLWSNLIPIMLFCAVCFLMSSKTQLVLARLFSVCYAFIMMSVLVGTGIQISREGLAAPTSIFVLALSGIFTVAAFFHPREFPNIFYGLIFFLMIPATYILMALYALINLNVINWGTREAVQKAMGGDISETTIQQWLKKIPFLRRQGDPAETEAEKGKMMCTCERLCQCFMCPDEGKESGGVGRMDERMMWIGEHLERLDRKLEKADERWERRFRADSLSILTQPQSRHAQGPSYLIASPYEVVPEIVFTRPSPSDSASVYGTPVGGTPISPATPMNQTPGAPPQMNQINGERYKLPPMIAVSEASPAETVATAVSPAHSSPGLQQQPPPSAGSLSNITPDAASLRSQTTPHDAIQRAQSAPQHNFAASPVPDVDSATPRWMEVDWLKAGSHDILDEVEHQFWNDFVHEYVTPKEKTKQDEAREVVELQELRNKVAFALLCLNGLLVLIIYLLQVHKSVLSIKYMPYANYTQLKKDPLSGKELLVVGPLEIEPIGFTIIFFLLLILLIQTLGLLRHRFHTLSHILASTVLTCFRRRDKDPYNADQILEDNAIDIARNLQRLDNDSGNSSTHGVGMEWIGRAKEQKKKDEKGKKKRRRVVFALERARKAQKPHALGTAFQKRFFSFTPQKNTDSLKGVQFKSDSPLFQPGQAQAAAAQAILERRDRIISESLQKKEINGSGEHIRFRDSRSPTTSNLSSKGKARAAASASAAMFSSPKIRKTPDDGLDRSLSNSTLSLNSVGSRNSSFLDDIRGMLETDENDNQTYGDAQQKKS